MTQSYVAPYAHLLGDGVSTVFPYAYYISAASEMEVYADGVLTTAYSLTGVGNQEGGNIIFNTAPGDGVTIFHHRTTPKTQLTDYVDNDPGSAAALEDAFDKITRALQDLDEVLSRVPKLAQYISSSKRNMTMPTPVALQLLGYNSLANDLTLFSSSLLTATPDPTSQLVHVQDAVEVTPTTGQSSYTASAFVSAGIILAGVTAYVKTTLGNGNGLTTWSLGTAGFVDKWATGIDRTAATATNSGQWLQAIHGSVPSALDVVITADAGQFDGTGVIVLTYSGWYVSPKQSA